MEPLTTSVIISSITTYLATKLKENKSIDSFFSEFTEATVNWIKPLFITEDGNEKEVIAKLKEKPDSPALHNSVKSILELELEENPNSKKNLEEMYEVISKTDTGIKIVNSKNINTGNVNTQGGDFILGDGR